MVRLVIEQEIFYFSNIFLQIERFFLVILNLHNSKTTCDGRKPIVDLESALKNMSIKKEKRKNARNYRNFTDVSSVSFAALFSAMSYFSGVIY